MSLAVGIMIILSDSTQNNQESSEVGKGQMTNEAKYFSDTAFYLCQIWEMSTRLYDGHYSARALSLARRITHRTFRRLLTDMDTQTTCPCFLKYLNDCLYLSDKDAFHYKERSRGVKERIV